MGREKYDELREERRDQEERREERRDEVFEETGDPDNEGSQDRRREEGNQRP